ncbi:hypothetical protein AURDEDRAFT_142802 [Auricularia subglabra TFB-10046 SS5]|nr:hypothetical protein AURDEDRAFT_142802 [Auricularia subglabra TFB-10046 SS5]
MYHPAPRRSLDETSAPVPSTTRRRKTVSFTELPSLAYYPPSRPGHVPSYKKGEVPPPRASSLAPKHRRHDSEDHVLHIRPRPEPIVTAFASPSPPRPAKRAVTLDDAVAHSPWSRPRDAEKGDPRYGAPVRVQQLPVATRATRVDTFASLDSDGTLSTPPVDQPISLPLPLQRDDVAVPPSPATSASSFFSDSTIPYLPLPSPLRPQHFDGPPPSPELSPAQKASSNFSPGFASSLLFCLAMGTIVQEASTESSRVFFALDILVYYSLFVGALAVFGSPWLLAWSTIPFLIIAFDITSLRERHLVEFGPTDPQEDLTQLAADSDTDSTPLSVEAKLARHRRAERAHWTPLPYLVLSCSLFLACLVALAAAWLFHVRNFVWFNLGPVCFWMLGCFVLERQYPQCKLHSRRKALFRKDEVERIAVRQALHRLAPAALIALTYYLLRPAPASTSR